jgi:ABC-type branched-chain amino acid transport systems, periplasmic component
MKKFTCGLLIMGLLVTAFTGCNSKTEEKKEDTSTSNATEAGENVADEFDGVYTIGALGPLTGEAASYGNSVKNGAAIAVKEINAAGGIKVGDKSYEVVLEFQDDEATADKAVTAYNLLMDKNADAILGAVTSGASLAVTDMAYEDGILMLTPSGSAQDITKNDNVFRVCFTDPLQGELLANYAFETAGVTKVAIIYNNSDEYSTGIKETFEAVFKDLGGTIVAAEAFAEGAVDYSTQLTKIKNTEAELIFVPAYYQNAAYITQQAQEAGMELPFIGSDGWDGVVAQVTDTAVIEGAVFLSPFLPTDPAAASFVAAYEAAHNTTPDQFAADGYDGVYIIKAAVEQAGSIEKADVIAAMTEIEVEGVTGNMKFDENGEPDKDAKFVIIKDGKYELNK